MQDNNLQKWMEANLDKLTYEECKEGFLELRKMMILKEEQLRKITQIYHMVQEKTYAVLSLDQMILNEQITIKEAYNDLIDQEDLNKYDSVL